MSRTVSIEPLEARIAPAIMVVNSPFDIVAAAGQKAVTFDLDKMLDDGGTFRTYVQLVTNFIPQGQTTPGVITIELFNDKAPLTVANFLSYVNNANAANDYDGLFFHRLVQGFVLQGGGFTATDNSHIETFPPIYNEFDPTDPERSNVAHTVAMAKVATANGGGPHSATSEFFINLADNAENLDNQNGGFTVFGRITPESVSVVNEIANLQVVGGAPVQNYPGSGAIDPSQKIQIVDALVVTPTDSPNLGFQYNVTITDSVSGAPTKLITSKVNANNELTLNFAPGKVGVAKVSIEISKTGEAPVTEEFLVTVKPNLITEISDDGLATTFVPGDKGVAKVKVTNTAGGFAKGTVTVQLYLSKASPDYAGGRYNGDEPGFTLDEDGEDKDILLTTITGVKLKVAPGKSATIPVKYAIPANSDLLPGESYRLLVKVTDTAGMKELYTDDNVGNHQSDRFAQDNPNVMPTYDLAFGSVGARKNVPLTLDTPNGELTFNLTGKGVGVITKAEDGSLSLSVTGTDATSVLSVKTARGVVGQLDDVFIGNTIGQVKLGNINLLGHFAAAGGAKSIVFGDLGNTSPLAVGVDKDFSVNAFPVPTQTLSLRLGQVRDYSLNSSMPVGKLTAHDWLNDEANTAGNQIFALAFNQLRIGGDLEADILIASDTKFGQLIVGGTLRDATVKTLGDIGSVKLGALAGSTILAGLNEKPDAQSDFVLGSTISSFIVTGIVSDSVIAAANFNSIVLGGVDENAGDNVGGIYADAIKSYLRKGTNGVKLTKLDDTNLADSLPTIFNAGGNYQVALF